MDSLRWTCNNIYGHGLTGSKVFIETLNGTRLGGNFPATFATNTVTISSSELPTIRKKSELTSGTGDVTYTVYSDRYYGHHVITRWKEGVYYEMGDLVEINHGIHWFAASDGGTDGAMDSYGNPIPLVSNKNTNGPYGSQSQWKIIDYYPINKFYPYYQ